MTNFVSIRDIPQILDELQRENFFGSITIDFRSGEPILLRQERTIKFEKGNTLEQSDNKYRR
jgi:hypothetical protein